MPEGFDEKLEEEKEDKILKYIEERDCGKLKADGEHMKDSNAHEDTTSVEEQTTHSTPEESGKTAESVSKNLQQNSSEDKQDFEGGLPNQTSNGGLAAPGLSTQPETDKPTESAPNDLQQNSSEDKWVFGGDITNQTTVGGFASFAAMSSGVQNIGFKKDPGFQFPGAGQVMFQSQTAEETGETDPTSYKCEAQFKPVLAEPPPLIEVKTGEEGEEVLFKERCTLFRYDKETKQWKERGRGDIKILRNDQHNIYRVVMRREQIFKVCANHVINDTTKPEPHLGSVKTCSYFAMDYTESTTPTGEKFAVRFKTEELCKVYMDKIEEIKKIQNSQQ